MPHLVRQDDPELIFVEHLQGRRVQHDERGIDPIGAGVEDRGLGDVQLGDRLPVERGAGLDVQRPEPGELGRADPYRVALEEHADSAFSAQHAQDFPDDVIEAREASQSLERCAIRGVLPGDWVNLGERPPGPGRKGSAHG